MDINKTKPTPFPGFGNGLAADKDIEAGEVLLGIINPYLAIVENGALNQVCSQCFTEAPDGLKGCLGCSAVKYCSTACQSRAWESIHKKECRILRKLPQVPPTPVRGLMQLLLRKKVAGSASDPCWVRLEGHDMELKSNNRWDEIVLQATAAVEWTASPPEYMESALDALCRMATNAFRVTLADGTAVGLCFEPKASLANHSCVPNAFIMFDGRYMTLRALDPIQKGEQVFISYIDVTEPHDRGQELKNRYFFTCQCAKCVHNDGPYGTLLKSAPATDPRLELFLEQKAIQKMAKDRCPEISQDYIQDISPRVLELLLQSRDPSITSTQKRTFLKKALAICEELRNRTLFAQTPYPTILHEIYLHYLDTRSTYTKAVSLLLFIYLNCDVYNYPQPHHPIRVTRLFTIAKLLKNIDDLQNIDVVSAYQVLIICVRNLAVKSHGAESRFMKEVEEGIEDVEAVQRTRGDAGAKLSEWGRGESSEAGKEYAMTIFEGLRRLGEGALEALDADL